MWRGQPLAEQQEPRERMLERISYFVSLLRKPLKVVISKRNKKGEIILIPILESKKPKKVDPFSSPFFFLQKGRQMTKQQMTKFFSLKTHSPFTYTSNIV